MIVFVIGFLSNLNGGFRGSWAYPFAKATFCDSDKSLRESTPVGCSELLMQGGGYSMDLNFAMLVLPTLKSLQTATRRAFRWWTVVVLSCCRQSVFFSLEPNAGEVVLFRPARTKDLHFLKSVTFKFCSLVGFFPQEIPQAVCLCAISAAASQANGLRSPVDSNRCD